MARDVNGPQKRVYRAPRRAAGAAQTREVILAAAAEAFGMRGWSATTIAAVAAAAGVSPKTVEAVFGTKPALLGAVVDYVIRGDAGDVPIVRREAAREIESAPDAATMLERHAEMICAINARSAGVAAVVETAAHGDESVALLWERMRHNHRSGVRWAARTLLTKPGVRPGVTPDEVEEIVFLAMSFGTYRALVRERGLTQAGVVAFVKRYYRRMLLAPAPPFGAGGTGPRPC